MPNNFPEAWLSQVETALAPADEAPWLMGIPEISNAVNEINGGSESEQNQVHIPATDFDVDILINNTTYPLTVQQYTDTTITVQLDKYQTKQVPLNDDQTIGASYDLINQVTGTMVVNINETKYAKAIHSLGTSNASNTPVVVATGQSGVFDASGVEIILKDGNRLRCTWKDIRALKAKIDKLPKQYRWPAKGRRLVLCNDHWNDLLLDRGRYADQLINYNEGSVAPVIMGFQIYSHLIMPLYNTAGTTKLAYGATATTGQYEGSVAFHERNVGIKTGLTKQYFLPSNLNPASQSNILSYRHYYIVVPKRARFIAGIASVDAS
jgi:hypothetical protein